MQHSDLTRSLRNMVDLSWYFSWCGRRKLCPSHLCGTIISGVCKSSTQSNIRFSLWSKLQAFLIKTSRQALFGLARTNSKKQLLSAVVGLFRPAVSLVDPRANRSYENWVQVDSYTTKKICFRKVITFLYTLLLVGRERPGIHQRKYHWRHTSTCCPTR